MLTKCNLNFLGSTGKPVTKTMEMQGRDVWVVHLRETVPVTSPVWSRVTSFHRVHSVTSSRHLRPPGPPFITRTHREEQSGWSLCWLLSTLGKSCMDSNIYHYWRSHRNISVWYYTLWNVLMTFKHCTLWRIWHGAMQDVAVPTVP